MIRDLLGISADNYDTLITVGVMLVLVYGMDLLASQVGRALSSSKIRRQLDGLTKDVATQLGVKDEEVKKVLAERYSQGRIKQLFNTVIRFFAPSRKANNAPVVVGTKRIEREAIEELPTDIELEELEEQETTEQHTNVEIEIHAQDIDKEKRGWAGIPKGLADRRIRMEIFPPIKPDDVWMKEKIRGDIILVSRRKGEKFEPYLMHLVKLHPS